MIVMRGVAHNQNNPGGCGDVFEKLYRGRFPKPMFEREIRNQGIHGLMKEKPRPRLPALLVCQSGTAHAVLYKPAHSSYSMVCSHYCSISSEAEAADGDWQDCADVYSSLQGAVTG